MSRPSESNADLNVAQTIRALSELDDLERGVLVLVYWRDRTQAQVAADLRLPIAAVRSAAARGLQQLAERIVAAG